MQTIAPAYETLTPHTSCERIAPRTNMFVLATLVAGGASNRVKIRNLSESGALIEAPLLPRPGTAVRLCRADTVLNARVVWSDGKRAGLRFDGRAVIGDWLPSTNAGQRAVDQEVELAKAEKRAGLLPSAQAPLPSSAIAAQDLVIMAAMIERLADDLVADPAVVAKYMSKLQILDVAGQTLRKLAQQSG